MTAQRAHPPDQIAPWAEIVPNMPPMTTDELHAIPDDGYGYELVQGVLVRMPLSSGGASSIGSRLLARLQVYAEDNGLGVVTGEQGGYRLDPAHPRDTEVAPDVGFVRLERAPSPDSPEYFKAWSLAPDLAVEVASGNQYAPGLAAKARSIYPLERGLCGLSGRATSVWTCGVPVTTRRHRSVSRTRSTPRTWYPASLTLSRVSSPSSLPL